ncbi:MAG: hypothetical protein ACK4YP_08440, partial [Myxococcota bacterium]
VLFFVAVSVAGRGGSGRAGRFAAVGTAAWMALAGALAYAGVLADFDARPPPMAFLFLGTFAIGMVVGLSRVGASLARAFPLWALVLVQGFRFPLELLMHEAAAEGTMPDAMTWTGWNYDVLTGLTALVVAPLLFAGAPRALAWAWNVLGILTLAGITVVAFLASPMVGAFGPDQRNTWVTTFPFVWLPTVLVASAVAGHVIVTRRLLAEGRAARK